MRYSALFAPWRRGQVTPRCPRVEPLWSHPLPSGSNRYRKVRRTNAIERQIMTENNSFPHIETIDGNATLVVGGKPS
jgi:hypothetical protein